MPLKKYEVIATQAQRNSKAGNAIVDFQLREIGSREIICARNEPNCGWIYEIYPGAPQFILASLKPGRGFEKHGRYAMLRAERIAGDS